MAAVYSVRFSAFHGPAGTVSYTVPPAQVAILRDIDIVLNSTAGVTNFSVVDHATGTTLWFVTQATAAITSFPWRGRQVFEPGAGFDFVTGGPGVVNVMASGYLLSV